MVFGRSEHGPVTLVLGNSAGIHSHSVLKRTAVAVCQLFHSVAGLVNHPFDRESENKHFFYVRFLCAPPPNTYYCRKDAARRIKLPIESEFRSDVWLRWKSLFHRRRRLQTTTRTQCTHFPTHPPATPPNRSYLDTPIRCKSSRKSSLWCPNFDPMFGCGDIAVFISLRDFVA